MSIFAEDLLPHQMLHSSIDSLRIHESLHWLNFRQVRNLRITSDDLRKSSYTASHHPNPLHTSWTAWPRTWRHDHRLKSREPLARRHNVTVRELHFQVNYCVRQSTWSTAVCLGNLSLWFLCLQTNNSRNFQAAPPLPPYRLAFWMIFRRVPPVTTSNSCLWQVRNIEYRC